MFEFACSISGKKNSSVFINEFVEIIGLHVDFSLLILNLSFF